MTPRLASALHLYQTQAAGFLYDNPGSALFADLGLGKTAVSLTLLARLKAEGSLGRALVIGPLRVVNETWPDEIAAWRHTAGLTYSVLTGALSSRQTALAQTADVHLVNREQVVWLVEQYVDFSKKPPRLRRPWPYDVIVVDELTGFGDHASQRFKALRAVRKMAKRFHGLTATPAAEGYAKMFAMTYLLDGGERFGKGITRFREAYFDLNPYTHQWKIKPGSDQEITRRVSDIVLLLRAEDHLPREKPTFIDRRVHLTAAQMTLYKSFQRDFYAALPDGAEIEAVHAAALGNKLLQLASGAVYDAERKTHFIHDHKTEALTELVEEAQGEPIMVAYWFKSSLERLKKAFPKAQTLDDKGVVLKRWNERKVPLLLVHPQSAGHGLNLQYGGSVLAWFDLPMSLELYLQTIGRIDRQGQTHPVRVYHLVAADTDDEMAVERLARKESVQAGFFERIRKWKAEHEQKRRTA